MRVVRVDTRASEGGKRAPVFVTKPFSVRSGVGTLSSLTSDNGKEWTLAVDLPFNMRHTKQKHVYVSARKETSLSAELHSSQFKNQNPSTLVFRWLLQMST